ncbi:MAG: hypothetical protein K0R31_2262 [Clostridiales bacterium]|jgi:uncharacterized membrane protein|nr:hypothetical protein [Clostridiales bacterium]
MKPIRKLTISAIVIALYVIIMYTTQWFAFGQYQVRIATSLYSLSYIFPFLVLPLGLSNLLSNTLMGGLGPLDMIGGFAAGIITSGLVYLIRKYKINELTIALPIILIPGLLVPVWLSYLINVPYSVLAVSVTIGQIIPGIVGVLLVKRLKNIFQ